MKRSTLILTFVAVICGVTSSYALKPRIVFDKYVFSEGVNPKARNLDELMVKFFDEDMVRLRDGRLISTNGRASLNYTSEFLARHPEIKPEVIIKSMSEADYEKMIFDNEQKCGVDLIDLFSFYRFKLPTAPADARALLHDILNAPEVEIAYYEPIPIDLTCTDIGQTTPDYTDDQQYHDPAPEGVDYDYAQSAHGADVVDGNDTWWAGIVESGFTLGHEDVTNPNLGFSGSWNVNNDHGTACTGVIGACDDNGIGCIGFAADWSMYLFARGSDAYGSLADCVTDANNDLIEGEVVNHSWGYTADPMPAGNTCPCNEDQNGTVPCEYNPSVRAAVQNGGGEFIYHLCAAANGCVDLDDPVFNGYFSWENDTWSVFVGGVQWQLNGSAHDAICFTDWGDRVTSNAWANGVRTHGYASSWPPDSTDGDPDEYYCWFSGTSAATPILTGVTAVVSRMWYLKWGNTYLHPQTMRSLLTYIGTEPGSTPGEIGVMPDLRAILGANLEPHWQADGWDYTIVPRNTNDATFDNVSLPATLNPAPATTYLNWNVINESLFKEASPAKFAAMVDDEIIYTATDATLDFATWDYRLNQSAQIRGGRHTLTNRSDPLNELVEGDETDNNRVESFVWNPTELSNTASTLSYPPKPFADGQSSPYRNRDGFRNTSPGQWRVAAIMCETPATDYDISIYNETPNSTFGYQNSSADGALSGDRVDIVGRNRNTIAGQDLLGVTKNNSSSTSNYKVHAVGSNYVGTVGPGRNLVASGNFSSSELLYAIEFNVNQLVPYTVELEYLSGGADLIGEIFEPALGYFYGNLSSEYFSANSPGHGWLYHFTPAQLGRHCLVIHKYDASDYNETADFNVYLGKSLPDLKHVHNSNWPEPIVVTQSVMAFPPPVIPPFLNGNVNTNRVHAQYTNIGGAVNPAGVVNDRFLRDGANPVWTTGEWSSWDPGDTTYWSNQGPFTIFGGRHTITDIIDVNNELTEWYEDNNRWDVQYVWNPFTVNPGQVYLSPGPAPNSSDNNSADFFTKNNCDGWAWRGQMRWTGAAECQIAPSDWNDIVLYENHLSATVGFEDPLVGSQMPSGLVQFVVVDEHVESFEGVHEVGVFNRNDYPEAPSSGRYYFQAENAGDILIQGCNGPYQLLSVVGAPLPELFHIYEANLIDGEEYAISLENLSNVDLNIGVYGTDYPIGSRQYIGENAEENGPGGDETIFYTPTETATHAIVVYRNGIPDLSETADYIIRIGPITPLPPEELVMTVIDNTTDPVQMRVYWRQFLSRVCPVETDSFRVYVSYDDDEPFDPNTWTLIGTTTDTTMNFDVAASIEYFRMVVVAIDINGLIIAPGGDVGATSMVKPKSPAESGPKGAQ